MSNPDKWMRRRQTSQLLKQLLLLKLQQNDTHTPHPNVELFKSDKGGRRNNFLYLLLVCVYLIASVHLTKGFPHPLLRTRPFTFQEKQCGWWPLESSRDPLLGRIPLKTGILFMEDISSPRLLPPLFTQPCQRDGLYCLQKIFQSKIKTLFPD